MNNICSVEGCKRERFENHDKCILHCDKSLQIRRNETRLFTQALKIHIVNTLSNSSNRDSIHRVLTSQIDNEKLNASINLHNIAFPINDEKNSDGNYLKYLNKLAGISFVLCKFYGNSLDLENVPVYFQECIFHDAWHQGKFEFLENKDALYRSCTFEKNIHINGNPEENIKELPSISKVLFDACTVQEKAKLNISNIKIKGIFMNSDSWSSNNIGSLNIFNSIIENDVDLKMTILSKLTIFKSELRGIYFKRAELELLEIEESVFKGKFDLQKSNITCFKSLDSNFEHITTFGSTFTRFSLEQAVISGFAGFEKSTFKELATFKFVTFENFSNFRNSTFKKGLNLETINAKEPPNFLNINLNSNDAHKNTNRETFRTIKYSFDRIGNTIEANKFYAYEMDKHYSENLKNEKCNPEKFIFWINKTISDFGQNYTRPLIGIIITMMIFSALYCIEKQNFIYHNFPSIYPYLFAVKSTLNSFAQSIIPLAKFLPTDMEFIGLLFYLIQAPLIWQAIVAIKRQTKR